MAAIALRHKRERTQHEPDGYGTWLGRPCWMWGRTWSKQGKVYDWVKYRVVAVSHKGGIAIRRWDDDSGRHAFWVDKDLVPQMVRWSEPAPFADMTIGSEE